MDRGLAAAARRVVGDRRTAVAARAAETEGRTPPRAGSGLPDRHPLRDAQRHPLGDVATRTRVWQRGDVSAPPARLANGRGLGPNPPGATRPSRRGRQDRLVPGSARRGERPGKKGGVAVGPNRTDRGTGGTKRHLVTDRRGIPLAVRLTGANRHESTVFEELLDAIPPIKRPSGRRCRRPDKLHADKAYDAPRAAAGRSPADGSRSGSPARGSSPRSGWAATAGWLSARWRGSTATAV